MTAIDPVGLARPRSDYLGRVAAVLTVGSACFHLLVLGQHPMTSPALALLITTMVAACLVCAKHSWCAPSVRIFAASAVMNTAMVLAHLLMMPSPGIHHQQSGSAVLPAGVVGETAGSGLMGATVTLTLVELVFCVGVVFLRTRSMPAIVLAGPESDPLAVQG